MASLVATEAPPAVGAAAPQLAAGPLAQPRAAGPLARHGLVAAAAPRRLAGAPPLARPAHPNPWAVHVHPVAVAVVLVIAVVWSLTARRLGPPTRRQWWLGVAALLCALVTVTWPLADLAQRWSLLALVVQRLLLMLVVAPLALAATPTAMLATLTRPAPIDRALEILTHPAVAVAVVSVVSIGTLLPGAVNAQATSTAARAGLDLAILAAGVVLWGPVLRHIPGASRPTPVGTAVYLVVQSLVPTFLAVVYVFARHPFYAVYAHAAGAIGISPVADQEIAGIVGKMGTLPILWTVAWREVARGRRLHDAGVDGEPLWWPDVQRQLERSERRQSRAQHPSPWQRHRDRPGKVRWRPELVTSFPTVEPPRASTTDEDDSPHRDLG